MLNIKTKISVLTDSGFALYRSAKSLYVMARTCLETPPFDFFVPGFLLMQQSIENFVKAILKENNISWPRRWQGHDFNILITLGANNNISIFKSIQERNDFITLLKELGDGYNLQRYGESGHFLENHEKMMDLFDELVYLFIIEFFKLIEIRNKKNQDEKKWQEYREKEMSLPVPAYVEGIFNRKLKQPFIFCMLPGKIKS